MANPFLDALEGVVNVLDTPGSVSRGLLSGQPGRAIGGIFDPKQRVHGRELLEQWGLLDPKESDGFDLGDAAGFAASIATDPLTFIPLGLGAKAARGAKFKAPVNPVASMAAEIPAASEAVNAAIPVAKRIAPTFYSRLEESIGQLPESINSQSVINRLKKGGVTDEEIEATNIARVLQGKNKVSRQELLDHFAENKVVVNEVMKGEVIPTEKIKWKIRRADNHEYMEAIHPDTGEIFGTGGNAHIAIQDANKAIGIKKTLTKYDDYQTPGGSNYRELVMTVPEKLPEGVEIRMVDNPNGPNGRSFEVFENGVSKRATFPTKEQAQKFASSHYQSSYTNAHWPDETNPIAHVRFNDRVGPNGEKILHIEEIQSDIHQEAGGRAGVGYLTKAKRKEFEALSAENTRLRKEIKKIEATGAEAPNALYDQKLRIAGQMDEINEMLPDLPFKKNWHELTMKRMIRYAAENGYDRITLNPGEQINKVLNSGEEALGGQKAFYGSPGKPGKINKAGVDREISNLHARMKEKGVQPGSYEWTWQENNLYTILAEEKGIAEDAVRGALPAWMKKYGKQYGVEVEPYRIGGHPDVEKFELAHNRYRNLLGKKNNLLEKKPPGWEAEYQSLRKQIDEAHKEVEKYRKLDEHPPVQVASMPLTKAMKESVMTRGQPLMQFAAPVGGSALLTALMQSQEA